MRLNGRHAEVGIEGIQAKYWKRDLKVSFTKAFTNCRQSQICMSACIECGEIPAGFGYGVNQELPYSLNMLFMSHN